MPTAPGSRPWALQFNLVLEGLARDATRHGQRGAIRSNGANAAIQGANLPAAVTQLLATEKVLI